VRTPVQNSGGGSPCGGSFSIDFNAFAEQARTIAGERTALRARRG